MRNLEVKDLGLIEYHEALRLMTATTQQKKGDEIDEVWLAEHNPVYTLGHAAKEENIFFKNDIPIIRSDRGGQVTYHGHGQLMIYFLLNLRRLRWGPKKLICELEQLIIDLLSHYGISSKRISGAPGIYVENKKIASVGLKITKGHCYHGISLNVDMDTKPFTIIDPCGFTGLKMAQLSDFKIKSTVKKSGEEIASIINKKLDLHYEQNNKN